MFWHKIFGNKKRNHSGRRQQSGFTFLEIVISLLVLTVGAFSMLQCVNVAMDANNRAIQEGIASNLASALMSEIMTKRFQENAKPTENLNFGIENGESRFLVPFFDDVDDYDSTGYAGGIFDSPPRTIGNTALANYQGFTRSVTVTFVEALDLIPVGGDGTLEYYDRFGVFFPAKRIIVTVDNGPTVHFELPAIVEQPL